MDELRRAIAQRDIIPHYQPKIRMATRELASVEALGSLVRDYQPLRSGLPQSWYRMGGSLERDVDFVSMAPVVLDEIVQERNWFEMEVLRSYHSLFGSALNAVRDVGYLIALNTHELHAEAARFRT